MSSDYSSDSDSEIQLHLNSDNNNLWIYKLHQQINDVVSTLNQTNINNKLKEVNFDTQSLLSQLNTLKNLNLEEKNNNPYVYLRYDLDYTRAGYFAADAIVKYSDYLTA